jgi:hypothetical protein
MYQQRTWSETSQLSAEAQKQFAERQPAQCKQDQFQARDDRFIASWSALASEYNEKGGST